MPGVRVLLDLIGAEHDAVPARDPDPPEHPYVVCSTPRSGSGLLCRGLAGRGAGAPLEYFNEIHRGLLTDRWGCGRDLDSYVRALYAHRTAAGGVLGVKLHWDQLERLRAETLGLPAGEPEYRFPIAFLEQLLPGATYVRIIRLDIDRQAVSLWFAAAGGTWSVAAGDAADTGRGDVAYDFVGIDQCRRTIENAELHWDRLLRHNGIEPLTVVYEQLAASYGDVLDGVLAVVAPERLDTPRAEPTTRRLSDDRSERFVERFVAERAERGFGTSAPPAPSP